MHDLREVVAEGGNKDGSGSHLAPLPPTPSPIQWRSRHRRTRRASSMPVCITAASNPRLATSVAAKIAVRASDPADAAAQDPAKEMRSGHPTQQTHCQADFKADDGAGGSSRYGGGRRRPADTIYDSSKQLSSTDAFALHGSALQAEVGEFHLLHALHNSPFSLQEPQLPSSVDQLQRLSFIANKALVGMPPLPEHALPADPRNEAWFSMQPGSRSRWRASSRASSRTCHRRLRRPHANNAVAARAGGDGSDRLPSGGRVAFAGRLTATSCFADSASSRKPSQPHARSEGGGGGRGQQGWQRQPSGAAPTYSVPHPVFSGGGPGIAELNGHPRCLFASPPRAILASPPALPPRSPCVHPIQLTRRLKIQPRKCDQATRRSKRIAKQTSRPTMERCQRVLFKRLGILNDEGGTSIEQVLAQYIAMFNGPLPPHDAMDAALISLVGEGVAEVADEVEENAT
uniref:Uncharacterized protein n=1 Tax=Oryza rufipogon TaxID=4529 RepID=A0A0E0NKY1_ORYRU